MRVVAALKTPAFVVLVVVVVAKFVLDKEEARKRFAPIFVKEYIDKQKKELAAGCSKLVFEDGFQIPEEVQNKIMEYM